VEIKLIIHYSYVDKLALSLSTIINKQIVPVSNFMVTDFTFIQNSDRIYPISCTECNGLYEFVFTKPDSAPISVCLNYNLAFTNKEFFEFRSESL